MVFAKVRNVWIAWGIGGATVGGAKGHEVGPSGANQEDVDEPTTKPMEIVPHNPLEERGPTYFPFESGSSPTRRDQRVSRCTPQFLQWKVLWVGWSNSWNSWSIDLIPQ